MILTYYTATTMIIIAYLLGSIPSAVWIGKKYYGIDIREYGSKNAGTTNMLRVLGKRAALPVFGLDFLKGFVAVTIIDLMKYDSVFADGANENWFYILRFIAVFAAVAGHIFPIFAGFRGGKGVATLVGAIMGVNAPLVLLCFGVWFLVLMVTHYVSLASMVAGCSFPIFTLISPKVNHLVPFVVFFVHHRHPADLHPPQEHRAAEGRHRIENIHLETSARKTSPGGIQGRGRKQIRLRKLPLRTFYSNK